MRYIWFRAMFRSCIGRCMDRGIRRLVYWGIGRLMYWSIGRLVHWWIT